MNVAINISSVYSDEGSSPFPGVDAEFSTIDLHELEGTNCYCDEEARRAISDALKGFPPEGIHIIDTGDYHYLTFFWMEKVMEPFYLALFDNHPDDQQGAFGPDMLSCGGWVANARESLPLLKGTFLNTTDIPAGLPVYLSIDIDVLSEQYARTDWDQGTMSLDELLGSVRSLRRSHRIIGADICGGLTSSKGARPEDFAVNLKTRSELLRMLLS